MGDGAASQPQSQCITVRVSTANGRLFSLDTRSNVSIGVLLHAAIDLMHGNHLSRCALDGVSHRFGPSSSSSSSSASAALMLAPSSSSSSQLPPSGPGCCLLIVAYVVVMGSLMLA
ncbi:hypothetical protein Pelo_19691 [Pelomyxa schiedti]|nr:hypothetical protein Pelo_19691 [Pelomyxa schiedti]